MGRRRYEIYDIEEIRRQIREEDEEREDYEYWSEAGVDEIEEERLGRWKR